jgi:hypothetical protein
MAMAGTPARKSVARLNARVLFDMTLLLIPDKGFFAWSERPVSRQV